MDFIGFYIPVSSETAGGKKMKINPQVIIQFCPQNTDGPLLPSAHSSEEVESVRAARLCGKSGV